MSAPAAPSRDNLHGSLFMVASMAGFAIEDMFIKQMAGALPVGQILILMGTGGTLIFGLLALARGDRLLSRDILDLGIVLRTLSEAIGTIGFITALALTPLASASAILQAVPLGVTLGAALFFGQQVGWRRWSAIAIGFVGVLLVLRPGLDGFEPNSLFAVLGVVGLAARDLTTRMVPPRISSRQLSAYAFAVLVPTGAGMLAVTGTQWTSPSSLDSMRLVLAIFTGAAAYAAIVAATRTGDVAVIAPFRYTRLVFALIVAALVFGERPDALTLTGAAIIVGSGLYTVLREARLRRGRLRASIAPATKL